MSDDTKKFKTYDVCVPVFKQGDDMHHCIEHTSSVTEAFLALADQYKAAASVCSKMAEVAQTTELEVQAGTHMIAVTGDSSVLDKVDCLDSSTFDEMEKEWAEEEAEPDEDDGVDN